MKFTKYHIAGKDYIYCPDKTDFGNLTADCILSICDRFRGAGADGIFTFHQTSSKTSLIKGFKQNGECMRNFSSASFCALFELFLTEGITEHTFTSENGQFFTVKTDISEENPVFSCTLDDIHTDGIFGTSDRKTEIGNRILTITPVSIHGIYAVHFTDCRDKLNKNYLGQHISKNSLFGKEASLILTEKTDVNSFDISFYENKTGCPRPGLSAFAAVGLAACRNGIGKYNEEISVSYNDNTVKIICNSADSVTIKCPCERVFEGKI
ncbi:MAG: hypothetical protein IJN70_04115 [Clostridia bacterium]|nr:hypothetical protein [Clostridia bacterium]